MTGTGGRFQQIHGVNEQQDFSNGLKTMTATDAADKPPSRRAGDRFSPSQVCTRGNSRKSSDTVSGFIGTSMEWQGNKWMPQADLRIPVPPASLMRPAFDPVMVKLKSVF
jgi:hypothetical protein